MQHSTTTSLQARLMHTLGRTVSGAVVLGCPTEGTTRMGRFSARLRADEIDRCIAARCQALVVVTACGTAVVTDFVAGPDWVEPPNIVRCDALHIGRGARLWADGPTLHIRAHNVDVRADGEQRLRGATINIG